MKILFALPGLHRIDRGAEIAFISVARELAKSGDMVTLIGSGQERSGEPYQFIHAGSISRDHFGSLPSVPLLRNDYAYEEMTFIPDLLRKYRPADYEVTLTCSYPFTNWALRRPALGRRRPAHVFVTENGDWPAYCNQSEYRFFGCEGLICTNPDFYERNRRRWVCQLIPNGVDCERFKPGPNQRELFGLPADKLIVLMVSALISSKRVDAGIEAVRQIPDAHLVVAGNGPLRPSIESMAASALPGRFTCFSVPADQMPMLYQSADVFLHLSREEAFGNVFLEAMACGLPIVAPDTARVRWIVGNDQFLLDKDDPSSTAAAVMAASAAPLYKRHDNISKAASFSWPRIARLYRDFLHGLAG